MDFTKVCRVCLSTDSLKQIFSDSCDDQYSKTLYNATGISITPTDELPQKICTPCSILLQNVIEFREKCQQTETRLLQLKIILNRMLTCDNMNVKLEDYVKTEVKSEENESDDDRPLQCLINSEQHTERREHTQENNINNCFEVHNHSGNAKESNLKVTCKLCGRQLSIKSLKGHMDKKHNILTNDNCKCEICKAEFDCEKSYAEHTSHCNKNKIGRLRGSSKELRECDICKKIMQKASLKMHKAIKHAGLGPVCEHCGRRFGNKYRLNEHYRAKHGYDKYKCTDCEFQSASVTALRNHERRHRGEKPFICESCGAKFHAAYLLAQHKQSHRTEKLVKCDLCPATFKANNSLHMHKISCHSSSQFKCTMCPRSYSCRHYAVKHIRQVHRYRGPVPALQKVPASDNEM